MPKEFTDSSLKMNEDFDYKLNKKVFIEDRNISKMLDFEYEWNKYRLNKHQWNKYRFSWIDQNSIFFLKSSLFGYQKIKKKTV